MACADLNEINELELNFNSIKLNSLQNQRNSFIQKGKPQLYHDGHYYRFSSKASGKIS